MAQHAAVSMQLQTLQYLPSLKESQRFLTNVHRDPITLMR